MGRAPCCEKIGLKKGRWTAEEDQLLINYIKAHGEGSWRSLPKNAGLLRCGKSCRLRWINYLREDLKRGNITEEEEETIVRLQASLGNRWSTIAASLPGRTDNEIKNYWNAHLIKKANGFSKDANLESGSSTESKRKRIDSTNRQQPSAGKIRKTKRGARTSEINGKGGGNGANANVQVTKAKGSRRKHDIDSQNKSGEATEAITLTTSTITVDDVLQIVDDEPTLTLDDGLLADLEGGEEEEELDSNGEPSTFGGALMDRSESGPSSPASEEGKAASGTTDQDGKGEDGVFDWEGLENIPWEDIGDTWQWFCEGNGESEGSPPLPPATVIDGQLDPFEEGLERWLFSDIV